MTDIVEELRDNARGEDAITRGVMNKGADEIERRLFLWCHLSPSSK